jgi:hypothetical protein
MPSVVSGRSWKLPSGTPSLRYLGFPGLGARPGSRWVRRVQSAIRNAAGPTPYRTGTLTLMYAYARAHRTARRATALLAACGTVATVPAVAAAAATVTVTVPGQCYVYWPGEGSQQIPLSVNGLTAGQAVKATLEVGGQAVSGLPSLTADSTGSVVTSLSSWTSGLGTKPTRSTEARLAVSDVTSGAEVGTASFKVANVAIRVDGARKSLKTKRVWEVSGLSVLSPENTYYAHYYKGTKFMGKQRLGQATDACGYIRVKKPLLPFTKFGAFQVRVQASQTFNADQSWIGGTVRAYKTYR